MPDECGKGDPCNLDKNAYIDVEIVDEAGLVQPGEIASVTAEMRAYKRARDDIVYGVLGTGSGEVIAVERMSGLGSGTLRIDHEIGKEHAGENLYFTTHWIYTPEKAAQNYDPDSRKALKVGRVADSGKYDESEASTLGDDEEKSDPERIRKRAEAADRKLPPGSMAAPEGFVSPTETLKSLLMFALPP